MFIPGYLLIYSLFPKKNKEIDFIERIALSFGLSIAIVPLIGLGLNYTTWGITLSSILTANSAFIILLICTSYLRWRQTPVPYRIKYNITLSIPKNQNRLDQALTIILMMAILIAITTLIYVISTPNNAEAFTEFYLLGPEETLDDYPYELLVGETSKIYIGLANHEQKQMTYTIEVWLINQTTTIDTTTNESQTKIEHMWYMDSFQTTLDHRPVDIESNWTKQWEVPYNFTIYRKGNHKLTFFLFNSTYDESYTKRADYVELADQKQGTAYQTLHLWLDIATWH